MTNYLINGMNKSDIIRQIDELMDVAHQLDNAFLYNRLFSIRASLIEQWNESELLAERILSEISDDTNVYYEGKNQ